MVSLRGICLLLQLVQPRRWRVKSAMKPTSRPPHWKGCHRWIHEERKSVWLALVLQIPCEKVSGTQNSLAEGIGVSESYISTYYFGWFPKNQPSYYRPMDPVGLEGVFFVADKCGGRCSEAWHLDGLEDTTPECVNERKLISQVMSLSWSLNEQKIIWLWLICGA